jgi:hypothetical protein
VRRLIGSYRMNGSGSAMVFVLTAALLVLILGPRHDRAPALVVLAILIAMVGVRAGTMRINGGLQQPSADPRQDDLGAGEDAGGENGRRRELDDREG